MKKILSILLASVMIISTVSMISVSAADSTIAPTESTTEVIEMTEPTEPVTEVTEPTTEPTQPETTDQKEKTYKDFTYSVKGNAVTITKYTGNSKSVTIPSEIDGKKVRVIGKKAFRADETNSLGLLKKNKTLVKITIPNSVYEIKASAFYNCVNLSKIFFGKNVKHIGARAFEGCKSLKEFKTPPKVTNLTDDVLTRTGIKYLYIGKNVKTINSSSFHNMFNKPMEKITVAKNNKNYSSEDGVLYDKKKTKLLLCPPSIKKESLTLPSSVETIYNRPFAFNKNLRTVILPNNLKRIWDCAFMGCKNLKEITIPKNVYEIGEYAFGGCKKLAKVTILNKDTHVDDEAFSGCGFKSVEVDRDIYEGYRGCDKLKKITILPDVTDIGTKQFFNCPKLKTVTIPKTVKYIGKKAFGLKYKSVKGVWKIVKVKGFTIKGKKNTAAHRYAKKHGFKFVEIS